MDIRYYQYIYMYLNYRNNNNEYNLHNNFYYQLLHHLNVCNHFYNSDNYGLLQFLVHHMFHIIHSIFYILRLHHHHLNLNNIRLVSHLLSIVLNIWQIQNNRCLYINDYTLKYLLDKYYSIHFCIQNYWLSCFHKNPNISYYQNQFWFYFLQYNQLNKKHKVIVHLLINNSL